MGKDTPPPPEGTTRFPSAIENFSTDIFGGLERPYEHTMPDGTKGTGATAEEAQQDAVNKSSK